MKKAFITLAAMAAINAAPVSALANDVLINSDAIGDMICYTVADNVAYLEEIRVNTGYSLEQAYREFYPEENTEFWDDAYKFLSTAPTKFKELHYEKMSGVFYKSCLDSLKK